MLYVVSLLGYPLLVTIILVAVATVFTNAIIDSVGHTHRGGIPRRTWVTHSIVTAPLWGAAGWAFVLVVAAALVGVFPPGTFLLEYFAWLGALAGWSHLVLDSVTEGGVFSFDGSLRALAHFAYDNPLLNLGFSALGVVLVLMAIL